MLRIDRIMVMSLWPRFLAYPVCCMYFNFFLALFFFWSTYWSIYFLILILINLTVNLNVRYFRAMANSEIPPVKDRLEMMTATQKDDTGLTRGLLHVLNRQVRALSCIILSLPDTRRLWINDDNSNQHIFCITYIKISSLC